LRRFNKDSRPSVPEWARNVAADPNVTAMGEEDSGKTGYGGDDSLVDGEAEVTVGSAGNSIMPVSALSTPTAGNSVMPVSAPSTPTR